MAKASKEPKEPKAPKGPEKVEQKESERANEIAQKVHSHEHAQNQEADLAKHPKFAKFKSHGGK